MVSPRQAHERDEPYYSRMLSYTDRIRGESNLSSSDRSTGMTSGILDGLLPLRLEDFEFPFIITKLSSMNSREVQMNGKTRTHDKARTTCRTYPAHGRRIVRGAILKTRSRVDDPISTASEGQPSKKCSLTLYSPSFRLHPIHHLLRARPCPEDPFTTCTG